MKDLIKEPFVIADEEGYIYSVSSSLFKEAKRISNDNSAKFLDYIGSRLDNWKRLPILTRASYFQKVGHVLTRG